MPGGFDSCLFRKSIEDSELQKELLHSIAKLLSLVSLLLLTSACSSLFPVNAGKSLAQFPDVAPKPGERAPDFVLTDLQGEPQELNELIGTQPIVLQFGSYTCPVFRYRRFDMQPLREKYEDQVTFLVVYTQEAHPNGAPSPYTKNEPVKIPDKGSGADAQANKQWVPLINRLSRVNKGQTTSLQARTEQASQARRAMKSNAVFLVDDVDNRVWQEYGQAPSSAFLIDLDGNVVLRQPWVNPKPLSEAIDQLLMTDK